MTVDGLVSIFTTHCIYPLIFFISLAITNTQYILEGRHGENLQ